jgi:hypothetical protein
VDRAIE